MKFNKSAKIITSLLLTVLMIVSLVVPAFAYQSAFKSTAAVTEFSQEAIDKVAGFEDGDNIFAMGEYDTDEYTTPLSYCESGLCQFNYQHNDGKWGRAIKDTAWSINGMAAVGDGNIDAALSSSPSGAMWFSRTTTGTKRVDANGTVTANGKYFTLAGWEFAADFAVKGFRIYFHADAIADDFDLLVGHLEGDEIVWEIAYCGNDITDETVAAEDCENDIVYFEADFCQTMEGRFIQIAAKSTDGMDTTKKSGHSGYFCTELEVYYGEVEGVNHTVSMVDSTATCTEAGLAAHYECEFCGKCFSDADGENEITADDIETVPALGHDYVGGECTRCHIGGGVITDAEGFLAMDPAGSYELANDITLDESYASTFTGSFDGKGYSVTTTVPMFAELGTNANVHDFTVEGEIAGDAYTGAAAKQIKSGATNVEIYNVVNNADITGGSAVGGIVGCILAGATIVTITDCENNGVISETTGQVGGIVGYAQGQELNITGCTNNADLTLTASYGGGIIGRFGKDAATKAYICRIIDCVNNGDFTAPGAQCGGMIGYVVGSLEITDCVNTGDITNTAADAGGMMGKMAVKGKTNASSIGGFVITGCVNYGAVTGGTYAGGIVAEGSDAAAAAGTYTKSYKINNCANFGNITSTASSNANSYAGGIAAYMFGGSTSNGIQNCINTGDVTVEDAGLEYTKNIIAGGIIGYFSATKFYVAGNINAGKVVNEVENSTSANFGCVEIYWNANASAENVTTYLHDNFALNAGDDAVYGRNSTEGEDTTTVFEADDLASGKVACDLNAALGKTVFVQNIDNVEADAPDEAPLPFGDALPVYDLGDGKYSNYEDGEIPACLISAQVQLGTNIALCIEASAGNGENAVLRVTCNGESIDYDPADEIGNKLIFIYPGITPQCMTDELTLELVVDDEIVDTVENFTVREYALAILDEYADDTALCTLIADMLEYGAAAQNYNGYNTDKLANEGVAASLKSTFVAPVGKVRTFTPDQSYNGNMTITATGMFFDYNNALYVRFNGVDPMNVNFEIEGYNGSQEITPSGNGHIGNFVFMNAYEFDTDVTVHILDNGAPVADLTYSVGAFVSKYAENNDAAGALVRALWNYGQSAAAIYNPAD
ncbi:MAG: hypothetical protein MJ102_06900 [Clostridia bacterium]|nr:hypothetical protein [Clostridia bacterium]